MNLPLFDLLTDDDELTSLVKPVLAYLAGLPMEQRVEALNQVRGMLHHASPFDDPVDVVYWVRSDIVHPNDYNPNVVYAPEMKLLETSMNKHVTQPVVTSQIDGEYLITDGEHRYITATTSKRLRSRLRGYVPVTVTKSKTLPEHMADTVEHNRARGVHKLDSMTEIVLTMLREGWSDDKIAEHLGMDADEILRMKQVSGIAKAFERPAYNRAWINDDGQDTLD